MLAARESAADLLAARAHSARLLGREPGLVLDGGGNASLKTPVDDGAGDALDDCGEDALLWVTPSGADLGGLSAEDFVPLDLSAVRALREGPPLDEAGLVAALADCRVRPRDPAPSIESLLHGWLPARFVDHSHAAAVQAVGNCEHGEVQLRAALGEATAVVPAHPSGDPVARAAAAAWESGAAFPSAGVLVLRHHGIVCWGESAESCWAAHLGAVERAEAWLDARGAVRPLPTLASERHPAQAEAVEVQRRDLEEQSGLPWREVAVDPRFFELPDARARAQGGPVTPGDLLRLGLRPLWLPEEPWRPGRHAALNPELAAAYAGGPEESAARAAAAVLENDLATRLRSSALGPWRSLSLSACEEAMESLLEQLKVSRIALGQPELREGRRFAAYASTGAARARSMTSQAPLQVAEAASTHGDAVQAAREAAAEVRERIGANPDFVLLFMTPHHREQASRVLSEVLRLLTPDALAGSTMSGVVGGGQEHLAGPGISLFAARVPGARVQSFNLAFEEEASMVRGWPDLGEGTSAALLADPFSFPAEPFLRSLREKQRFPALFGGLSSGADRRGGNLLFRDDEMLRSGGVGLALSGAAAFEPLVSQGTSPVGPVFEVTRAERNVIYSLSGRNAFEELRELLMALPADERRRFGRAPHVGIRAVPNDSGESSSDYLVRGVVHMDPESGAIALSDVVGDGLSLQFQARDRESADLDLRESLAMASAFHPLAAGALMFPCTGRGVHLFQEADHDVAQVQRYWPDLPAAGAFAAGEIGPVCGRPYIHSLSASIGLLVPRVA